MKTLFSIGILCIFGAFASSQITDPSACGPCIQEQCPPVAFPCDDLLQLDDCHCCFTCVKFPGLKATSSVRGKRSSDNHADQVGFNKQPAAAQGGANRNTDFIIDALHDTIVNQTELSPTLEDKIRNTIRHVLFLPLQRVSQVVMDLGTKILNLVLTYTESEMPGTGETAEISDNNDYFTTTGTPFPEKESTAFVNRIKREAESDTKKITAVQIFHQALKIRNVILQMMTDSVPQQVIHCIVSQVSVPGAHILANIVRATMEAIHESMIYTFQTTFFVDNPSWETLTQVIAEAIEKGFAKASTSIPKLVHEVKDFLSLNPSFVENWKDDPTQARDTIFGNIRNYLETSNKLIEEVTNAEMRQTVKSQINELAFPGHKAFAALVDAIMAVANVVSKTILESSFIKENSSLQNLLELAKNAITVGTIEKYKAVPEVIRVTIETIENNNFVETSNDGNVEQFAIIEATKIRPIMNAYLQLMCENFKYTEGPLQEQTATPSVRTMTPVLKLFVDVEVYIMEVLTDVGNVVCTSKVLNETDSWYNFVEASNLVNNIILERNTAFQSKYNSNSNDLNKLLKYLGCDGTTTAILHDEEFIKNKTMVEILQTALKHISNELKVKTNEMIFQNNILSVKLAKLPGGEVLNIITKIILQVVNEMSRKMSKSDFITKPPTWFNFWFSVIEAVTVGAKEAQDVFFEVVNATKHSIRNASIETSGNDRSERLKRESPSAVSPSAIGERSNPKPSPKPSSTQGNAHPSPRAHTSAETSTMKSNVRYRTDITLKEAPKFCVQEKCDDYSLSTRRFTPHLFSQYVLENLHQFIIQTYKGVKDITGFLASVVVPPFIRNSGIPFANEVSQLATSVITFSNEQVTKGLETPFLRNPPTWEAAQDFIISSIRNAAMGTIRQTIHFLFLVLDQLSDTAERNGTIYTLFNCKVSDTEHKRRSASLVSIHFEPASNKSKDPHLVQDLSSALSEVYNVIRTAVKNKDLKGTARADVPEDQTFLNLKLIRGILRFKKQAAKLVSVLIPEACIIPAQHFLKQTATGINKLTGSLAQTGISLHLKSSSLPFADRIADLVETFLLKANELSSDAANSKYLNEPTPTWSTAYKAIASGIRSGLHVSLDAIVTVMELMANALSSLPEIVVEKSDVQNRNEPLPNESTTDTIHFKEISTRPPLSQKRVKRGYLKRMRERDHSIF